MSANALRRVWEQKVDARVSSVQRSFAPSERGTPQASSYVARSYAMTKRERLFYEAPRDAVRGAFIIGIKMRLADIVEVADIGAGDATRPEFHRIAMKHVDFVLIDPRHSRFVLVVELDDETHQRQNRKERDDFLDRVLLSVNVPVLHQGVNDHGCDRLRLYRAILALCETAGVRTHRSSTHGRSGGYISCPWASPADGSVGGM